MIRARNEQQPVVALEAVELVEEEAAILICDECIQVFKHLSATVASECDGESCQGNSP